MLSDVFCTAQCAMQTLIAHTHCFSVLSGYCAYDYLVDQAKPLELLKALLAADPVFPSTQRHYQQVRDHSFRASSLAIGVPPFVHFN